jgi:hypothetical protein
MQPAKRQALKTLKDAQAHISTRVDIQWLALSK